ncbi:hypothetical protein BASA83_010895 [Batrachochytrium salamandrivorans]|nr:hypothetical protein BASA83_010895 [Batrachochytrium salamandrivorans]
METPKDSSYEQSTAIQDHHEIQFISGLNPNAGLNSAAIAANPSTDLPESANPTSLVTSLEKRGGTNKNKVSPTLFDKSMKLVAGARVSLTAAISAELELSVKMPKFFTKLSVSKKVAQYPIAPEYSVSASATASVGGDAKVTIGPQLALNDGTATLTALANMSIRAGVSANLFGVCFNLYTSPVSKVFTKEYKTLIFDKPPAEVDSIESAVKLST